MLGQKLGYDKRLNLKCLNFIETKNIFNPTKKSQMWHPHVLHRLLNQRQLTARTYFANGKKRWGPKV